MRAGGLARIQVAVAKDVLRINLGLDRQQHVHAARRNGVHNPLLARLAHCCCCGGGVGGGCFKE